MSDKVSSISEYTREQFFGPFVKYLHEAQDLVVLEEKKPESILFNTTPPILKKGVIELRPVGKGFDIYVDMSFGLLYKAMGAITAKGTVMMAISKAISRAKDELGSSVSTQTVGNIKYCIECGASILVDAAYCPKCGQKQR